MPAKKFWAYVRMMPVLQARKSIQTINEISLAFGSMEKDKTSEYLFNLQKQSSLFQDGPDEHRPYRPSSAAEIASLSGGSTKVA